MTAKEFYQSLSRFQEGVITLSPGPFDLKVGKADIMAARLILWLIEQLPDNTTTGDLDDILDAAKWWTTFWASVITAQNELEKINGSE